MLARYIYVVVLVCLWVGSVEGTLILDQEQNLHSGDISILASLGFEKVGQSFTAGITGALEQIDMGFSDHINGDGTVEIFSGSGSSGALLQTVTVQIYSEDNGQVNYNSLNVNVSVESGQQYTFLFEPNPLTMPDPYNVGVGWTDPYPGGMMVTVENGDPVGYSAYDLVFRTWVIPEPGTVFLLALGGLALLRKRRT